VVVATINIMITAAIARPLMSHCISATVIMMLSS